MNLVGKMVPDLRLDVVMQQEGGLWVARCVQLDLSTTDVDEDAAWRRIQKMAVGQVLYAAKHDPEFKSLFRPTSAALTKLMAMAANAGAVTVVIERSSLQINRLCAKAA